MKTNKNVFRIIRYFFRCKKASICACIMTALGLLVGIVTPICNKYIQQDIIPNKNMSLFIWLTALVLILNIVSALSSYFITKIFVNNGLNITRNIRKDIVKMNVFSNKNAEHKGRVLITSTAFLEEVNGYYISYMYLIFDCLLKFLFYFPFFVINGGYLSLIMIAAALVSFLVLEFIQIGVKKYSAQWKQADAECYDYSLNLVSKMQKDDFQEDEKYNLDEYMSKVKRVNKTWIQYCNYANLYSHVFNLIWYIGVGICYCLAFNMLAEGILVVATFIIFNSYLDQIKVPLQNYVTHKQATDNYEQTFQNIFNLLDDSELAELKRKQEDDDENDDQKK